jgi:hypothetical protein
LGKLLKFFLDTEVLVRAGMTLNPKSLRVFLDQARKEGVEIVTCEAVIDEAVNKYRERIEAAAEKTNTGLRDVAKATRQRLLGDINQSMIDTWCHSYQSMLEDFFTDRNGVKQIREYPKVTHKDVASRAVSGRKPYNKGEKDSYRDTLIWHAVLEEAVREPVEAVCLVTGNITDFGEKSEGKVILHRDLREEVMDLLPQGPMIDLLTSISDVVERHWQDQLRAIAGFDDSLTVDMERIEGFKRDIADVVKRALEYHSLLDLDAIGIDTFAPIDIELVESVEIVDFLSATASIAPLEAGILIQADVSARCVLNVAAYEPSAVDLLDIEITEVDDEDGIVWGTVIVTVPCYVSLLYNSEWEIDSEAFSAGDSGDLNVIF